MGESGDEAGPTNVIKIKSLMRGRAQGSSKKSSAAVMTKPVRGIVITAALSATMTGAFATPGFANWTSYIGQAPAGFQSRRWSDVSYSEVQFTECVNGYDDSIGVDLRRDISFFPDEDYGTKTFTACFGGWNSTSDGEWHGLASGDYFFQLTDMSGLLAVSTVYQDTTAAD